MNIFWIEPTLLYCARHMFDTHVVKMSVEYAQLLSTAHWTMDDGHGPVNRAEIYVPSHVGHPCSQWVRESPLNYRLLYALWIRTLEEYRRRYHRDHKSSSLVKALAPEPKGVRIKYEFNDTPTLPPLIGLDVKKRAISWEHAVGHYREVYRAKRAQFPEAFVYARDPMTKPSWLSDTQGGG